MTGHILAQKLLRRRGSYGQAQFSDLKDKLRLASYAHARYGGERAGALDAARSRSLATSNLTLDDFFRVLRKMRGAPDAELWNWMSLARQYVKA